MHLPEKRNGHIPNMEIAGGWNGIGNGIGGVGEDLSQR